MSEKHRNAQKLMPQSRKLLKYQKRKIRRYLKRVRWRRKRRQRYFLYGLALAVSMYLASIWKMRERIWSIREMDVIEYELPEGERAENGAEEAPADRQEKRTVERKNAGETYGATEKTGTSTKIRLHLKTGELEILHERERKALICFSALERQEEKLSAEKAEIVKQRVALYEQYADGNMSKEEFIRQRDAYRVQEDEKMEQIQRLRTEKNQAFQPVKRDTDHLQTVISTVEEAGDVMHLSQNVVETFIDRIEVFNDERVKIHFTFEDTLNSYEEK